MNDNNIALFLSIVKRIQLPLKIIKIFNYLKNFIKPNNDFVFP